MSRAATLTYRDYAALPEDGRRYELHDGLLRVTPAPSPQHQIIVANLLVQLRQHVKRRGLGEVLCAPLDVIFSDTTVLQPDLVWLEPSRVGAISRRGIEQPPTLVIEILSPSTAGVDRGIKRTLYRRNRVTWLWLVDPDARAIEVYRDDAPVTIASGAEPMDVPPFEELALRIDALWP